MKSQLLSSLSLACLTLALSGCAADAGLRRDAQTAFDKGDFETSLRLLDQARKAAPDSVPGRAQLLQTQFRVFDELLTQAEAHRASGRSDQAMALIERLLVADPSNMRAAAALTSLTIESRQTKALGDARELVKQGRLGLALDKVELALKENVRHPGLVDIRRDLEREKRARETTAAKGSLGERGKVSLDFRDASLRTVLDAIARSSGLSFIFDKDLKQDARVTVYLKDTPVEEALDLVTSTNQMVKKVLDGRTVLIYPNTPEKLKDYQEQVVRVFQLASVDAKAAAAFLKSMLRIKDPFVDEKSNVVALRESPENILLAERLMALFDAGEPEVLLELEVLEVSETKLTELGLRLPDTLGMTLLPSGGASGFTLGNITGLGRNNVGVAVGGAALNFKREVGDFTTLANPKIRAKSKEKASILIGDKIPVVTATTGNSGFVAESITYLDVGLKLNVEPTVYPDDEVGIRVTLEVSSLGTAVKTASGGLAYQIGTRNASTMLRLRDGETQMLAGLISRDERTSSARVPGLGDIPVVGRLLSSNRDTGSRTELVLAVTPRIIRNVTKPAAHEAELWVGTDTLPRLRAYGGMRAADLDGTKTAPALLPAPRSAGPNAAPAPDAAPVTPPALATGAATSDKTAEPQSGKAATDPEPLARLTWSAPKAAKVGEVIEVPVRLNSTKALRGAPTELAWDPAALELVDVREGDFFNRDGATTAFSLTRDKDGSAGVGIIRRQATAASGEAVYAVLRLKPLKKGTHELRVIKALPLTIGAPGEPLLMPEPLRVTAE